MISSTVRIVLERTNFVFKKRVIHLVVKLSALVKWILASMVEPVQLTIITSVVPVLKPTLDHVANSVILHFLLTVKMCTIAESIRPVVFKQFILMVYILLKCTAKSTVRRIFGLICKGMFKICISCNGSISFMFSCRRVDGSEDFNRSWSDYETGFGSGYGSYWVGLKYQQILTNGRYNYRLRVDLMDCQGNTAFSQYNLFNVSKT